MFDIGMTEMLMIAVVAIIVVGPKDLPGMLRTIGRYVKQIRSMARDFQSQVDGALKEAELDEVKNTLKEVNNLNPVNKIKSEVSDYMDSAYSLEDPSDEKPFVKADATDAGVPPEEKSSQAADQNASVARPEASKSTAAPKNTRSSGTSAARKAVASGKNTKTKPASTTKAKASPKSATASAKKATKATSSGSKPRQSA